MKKVLTFLLSVAVHIPAFSQNQIRINPDLELIRLSANAYIHVSYTESAAFGRYSSNGLVFINQNEAFLFDTPSTESLTKALCDWLEKEMKLEIAGFVPNHWHEDCMGGLGYIKSRKIPSYANQLTVDIAKSMKLPVPENGFRDSLNLMLGDKTIRCWFPGAAHSKDNIVVWIPSEKILFAGCMCKSIDAGNLGNVADGDITQYPATIDRVINKFHNAEIVIPGHGSAGGPELLKHTRMLAGR